MVQLQTPRIGGYHWPMAASKALEARIRDQLAKRGLQPATDEQMQAADERAQREWMEQKAAVLLGRLDERYREAVPRHQASVAWLAGYRSGDRRSMIILGDPGGGKTWELAAIARELMVTDTVPVTIVTEPDLYDALRPTKDGLPADIGQFQVAPVLGLDDFGKGRQSDWTREQLYRLAEFRNVRRLPTIITSNLTGEEIRAQYDRPTVDRLVQDAVLLTIAGPNHRSTPI